MAERPPSPYRNVLAAVDGSDLADRALSSAWILSAAFEADLHVVAVADDDDHRLELEDHIATAIADRGARAAGVHVRVGDDPATSIQRAAEALPDRLVCMGSHGRGRLAGALLGSVAASVLRQLGEPIVIAGPSCAERPVLEPFRLVVCLDGTPHAERSLPIAASWADVLGMELSLITVAEAVPEPLRPDTTDFRMHGPDHPEHYLALVAARLPEGERETTTHAVYDPISAADGLRVHLQTHPASLVAATTHGRQGIERVVLGSQAARIVHESPVPVLMVSPAPGEPES